jgi:lipid-A-disaccharide synthase
MSLVGHPLMTKPQKILMIAGEASGDHLGAELIKSLPAANIYGIGGDLMQKAGMTCLFHARDMAIVGIWEVIKHLPRIRRIFNRIKVELDNNRPDLIVLIDYPGFNLRVAKMAHNMGIRVVYYVSPQIWAWRAHRIHHIKKYVDHIAVLFSFEKTIYEEHKIPVTVVGHPLLNTVPIDLKKNTARHQLNIPEDACVIGLMPGSRLQEIQRLMPLICECIARIKKEKPQARFILPLADTISDAQIAPFLKDDIRIVRQALYPTIKSCDAIICCSGTVTLEVALLQTPMVIIYKIAAMSFFMAKLLVKTPFIGLSNIVAGTEVSKEYIQEKANADTVTKELLKILNDPIYCDAKKAQLAHTREHLGFSHHADQLAALITKKV